MTQNVSSIIFDAFYEDGCLPSGLAFQLHSILTIPARKRNSIDLSRLARIKAQLQADGTDLRTLLRSMPSMRYTRYAETFRETFKETVRKHSGT